MPSPSSASGLPPALFRAGLRRFFDRIAVDDAWLEQVRALSAQGPIVFILRSLNVVDTMALDRVTTRFGLPRPGFVNDLGVWSLNPFGTRHALTEAEEAEQLRTALETPGSSAALFLKRPPGVIALAAGQATGGRGLKEGESLMRALIELQQRTSQPIHLIPQVFVWSKRPDTRGTGTLDWVFGPREWPSAPRVMGQLMMNYGKTTLRGGEPVNLKRFLEEAPDASPQQIQRRVVYTLLRRMQRERSSVVGPADKPPDRVRQEILRSRVLQEQIKKLTNSDAERQAALERADGMLRKMQALPDGAAHRAMEVILQRIFHRIYAGLEVDQAGIAELRKLSRDGSVILLPSHKSHIDYLVVSYAFYKANLPLPLIVAGDNLNFFPMGPVFRHSGAFFIRRTFRGDRLYAAVVDAYVRRLVRDGYAIEVFLEGARSRTGKPMEPKFGLLSMLIAACTQQEHRPVYFVPISIGYERIIETESFQKEILGEEKVREDAAGLLSATSVLRHRYGRVNLQFGKCLSLREVRTELGLEAEGKLNPKQTRSVVTKLANRVMDEINRVTAVTPGALTALVLLSHNQPGLDDAALQLTTHKLFEVLKAQGARLGPALANATGQLKEESIREATQMFLDAGMIKSDPSDAVSGPLRGNKSKAGPGVKYQLVEARRVELDTSKNLIIHFFVERALVATAMPTDAASIPREQLSQRVLWLSRLFKHEFRFKADQDFDEIFAQTLEEMAQTQVIRLAEDQVFPQAKPDGASWLTLYGAMIRNFVEAYYVCALTLEQLTAPLSSKDLVKKALAQGKALHKRGELARRESISKFVFNNAFQTYQEQGLLRANKDKLNLTDAARDGKLEELLSTLKGFLSHPKSA